MSDFTAYHMVFPAKRCLILLYPDNISSFVYGKLQERMKMVGSGVRLSDLSLQLGGDSRLKYEFLT